MSEPVHHGGCGCGKARFTVTGEPIFVNNCHCRQCQQQTGSTSVVNAFFEAERLQLTSGETTEHELVSGSGGSHVIVRCAACGVAMWSFYPGVGRHGAGVRVGAFDDPAAFRPDAVIWTSEAMPWVTLPEGIPAFDGPYKPRDVLPPERFERLKALAQRG